jgi:hypothetical protein
MTGSLRGTASPDEDEDDNDDSPDEDDSNDNKVANIQAF